MRYSQSIKPLSYLKNHSSEIFKEIKKNREPMIITHNGEAKLVVQDIRDYEQTQESLAMLKILALSSENIRKSNFTPARKAFEKIRQRIDESKK